MDFSKLANFSSKVPAKKFKVLQVTNNEFYQIQNVSWIGEHIKDSVTGLLSDQVQIEPLHDPILDSVLTGKQKSDLTKDKENNFFQIQVSKNWNDTK